MRKLYLLIIMLPITLFSNSFQQGNIEFINKNYEDATLHYQDDINTSGYSVETLYNLSNIYQKLEKPGYALYYLYKARVLNPMEKYIQTDITTIKEGLELEDNYNHLLPIPYYLIDFILPISILLLIISISLSLFIKDIKYITYILILSFLISLTMKIYTVTKSSDAIIVENSTVQLSPYESSDITFNITETSIITINDEFEDYYYITDNSDRYGWIKKDMVGEIWK